MERDLEQGGIAASAPNPPRDGDPLLQRIEGGEVAEEIQHLIDEDSEGRTLLHLAIIQGLPEEISRLLDADATPTKVSLFQQDEDGNTPLHCAIGTKSSLNIIALLIDADPTSSKKCLFKQNTDGETPLHRAIFNRSSLDIIMLLIDADPTPTKKSLVKQDNNGWTPLHYAISSKPNLDLIKHLIDSDPTPIKESLFKQDNYGKTPLHRSVGANGIKPFVEVITLLIDGDPTPTKELLFKHDNYGWTPLHRAIGINPSLNVITLLVNADPTPSKESLFKHDKDGNTPLLRAIGTKSSLNIITLLVKADPTPAKASLFEQDKDGETPLHIAILHKSSLHRAIGNKPNLDVITLLVKADPTPSKESLFKQDKDGYTPLHFAAYNVTSREVIQYLETASNGRLPPKPWVYGEEYIHFPAPAIDPTNPDTRPRLHGGAGGEPFDYGLNNGKIRRISVDHTEGAVHALSMHYTMGDDRSVYYLDSMELAPDEYVTEVQVWYGRYVHALEFVTNKGKRCGRDNPRQWTKCFGRGKGRPVSRASSDKREDDIKPLKHVTIQAPKKHALVNVYGRRTGIVINAIGFHFGPINAKAPSLPYSKKVTTPETSSNHNELLEAIKKSGASEVARWAEANPTELIIADTFGDTPLNKALCLRSSADVIKSLIAADSLKASLLVQDFFGNTPLHTAIILRLSAEIVKILIEADRTENFETGASRKSIITKNYDGEYPLLTATRNQLPEQVIKMLVSADRSKTNDTGINLIQDICGGFLPPQYAAIVMNESMLGGLLLDQVVVFEHLPIKMYNVERTLPGKYYEPLAISSTFQVSVTRQFTCLLLLDFYTYIFAIVFFMWSLRVAVNEGDAKWPAGLIRIPAIYLVLHETVDFYTSGPLRWGRSLWNWLDAAYIGLLFASFGVFQKPLDAISHGERITLMITGGMVWVMLLMFLRYASLPFAVFVSGIIKIVVKLFPFIIGVTLLLLSFALMFQIQSLDDDAEGFSVCVNPTFNATEVNKYCNYYNESVASVCALYRSANSTVGVGGISDNEPREFCSWYSGRFTNACSLSGNPSFSADTLQRGCSDYGDFFPSICSLLNDDIFSSREPEELCSYYHESFSKECGHFNLTEQQQMYCAYYNESFTSICDLFKHANFTTATPPKICPYSESFQTISFAFLGNNVNAVLSPSATPINKVLSVCFAFLAVILLFNIVIAIINQSWTDVETQGAKLFWSKRLRYLELLLFRPRCHLQGGREGKRSGTTSWGNQEGGEGERWHKINATLDAGWNTLLGPHRQSTEYLGFGEQLQYFFLSIIAAAVCLVWFLVGWVSFGLLWPRQVRTYLFCPRPTSSVDDGFTAEVR